ncbi:RNA exonuclease 4-like isoform X2 [Phalaenopsis equestris]|nr:RNA exonuclease 4-like isoform X2 [Phalaenopsis equestris]XP_020577048.1 RNA exonuclease 4-like isoform X2 [Phalaenopsis equestris]
MKNSYHSVHQPKCAICKKYCKTLESVREHLTGPLAKNSCALVFVSLGCELCLKVFDTTEDLIAHRCTCYLTPATCPGLEKMYVDHDVQNDMDFDDRFPKVVALNCVMVGGGSDGSLHVCARVCLIDVNENVIFHSYVKPIIPVTDYRYEKTGISEDNLVNAMPIGEVQEKVLEILYNGEESIARIRWDGGKACLLVGHGLENDLDCLRINYPEHLIRDSAKYVPLLKTNLVSNSLKYLTRTYLGYEIQSGVHDPYENCVAALRLYKRLSSYDHPSDEVLMQENNGELYEFEKRNNFDSVRVDELLKKTPDELLLISTSNFRCWCLDTGLL